MFSLCELCGTSFNSRSELESHKKVVHDQSRKLTVLYKCEKCQKLFKNKALLTKHNITHSEERYSCKDCHKTFKRKYDAENHHKQQNPQFSCHVCQLVFKTKYNKNRHEKTTSCNLNQANQDSKFKCQICVKAFSRNDNLAFHMKTVHDNQDEN